MRILLIGLASVLAAGPALAQNTSSAGNNWSSSWGFSSVSDRTLALQRANLVRDAKTEDGPQTVIYQDSYTDARSNYIENVSDGAQATIGDVADHIGDDVGTQTYSVGSMNTGEISVTGDNNDITATNSATSEGCVDGSVNTSLLDDSTGELGSNDMSCQ